MLYEVITVSLQLAEAQRALAGQKPQDIGRPRAGQGLQQRVHRAGRVGMRLIRILRGHGNAPVSGKTYRPVL